MFIKLCPCRPSHLHCKQNPLLFCKQLERDGRGGGVSTQTVLYGAIFGQVSDLFTQFNMFMLHRKHMLYVSINDCIYDVSVSMSVLADIISDSRGLKL